jgi:methyl-accepting chemotaxis protein
LDDAAGALFGHCLSAFHAFQGLSQLAEDMRILSLNAELAAGRAGTAGVAVRALTQYTRQLVSQLNRLEQDMATLKATTNEMSASTMRDLHQLRLMRKACQQSNPAESVVATENHHVLRKAESSMLTESATYMRQMMENARQLAAHAGRIRQVADQSNGIATNIAIEAAAAGPHESEFRTVSDTMKQYIVTLQTMVERANQAIRQADEMGATLMRRLAASQASLVKG